MAVNSIYSNTIRFSGLATGLDTDKIVKELMNAHRIPLVRLQQQRQLLEWQKEAYREVNRLINNFREATAPLRLQSTFLAKTASVNNTSVANVTVAGQVTDGLYTLHVKSLARGASLTGNQVEEYKGTDSQLKSDVTVSEIYINDVKIELTGNTVGAFVAAVNSKSAETGVRVSFDSVTQRFFFTTIHSGETYGDNNKTVKIDFFGSGNYTPNDNYVKFLEEVIGIDKYSIAVMASGAIDKSEIDVNDFSPEWLEYLGYVANPSDSEVTETNEDILAQLKKVHGQLRGQNAVVEFQGTEMEFTSNSFSINGLSVQLKGTGEVNITVTQDIDTVVNVIKKFIEEYNKLVDEINKKLQEPRYRDYQPLTDEQKEQMTEKEIELWEERAKSGLLRNDSILVSFLSQLRLAIYSTVESSAFKNLPAISIETGSYYERGKLVLKSEDQLRKAIMQNPEEVIKLFTVNEEGNEKNIGIGWRLYNLTKDVIDKLSKKAGNLLSYSLADNSTLGKRIKELDERISQMQNRLIAIEQRYWAQFTALERAIARMNMQSAWLAQTFGGGQ